jgi:cbb3-type cytochrome oxidase subunit 3
MTVGAQFLNDNGISAVALAFFTALFGAIGAVFVQGIQAKQKAEEAKHAALETKQEAEQAKLNTESIANGFAGNVDRKLNQIITEQKEMGKAFRKHLEWHLNREDDE